MEGGPVELQAVRGGFGLPAVNHFMRSMGEAADHQSTGLNIGLPDLQSSKVGDLITV